MTLKEVEFVLPIGYEDENGNYHKTGKIRQANALDEIEIHNDDKVYFNQRYHDILLFSRIISRLGEINPITVNIIENLYEVDFRYLQSLYKQLNEDIKGETIVRCPECGSSNKIDLAKAYENVESFYKNTDNQGKNKK